MQEKEIDVIIQELRELFEITDNGKNGNLEGSGKFYINKMYMQRIMVVEKLQNYFEDTNVKDGFVSVSNITFVFTSFEVCKGKPS